jgi:hypothetical protein
MIAGLSGSLLSHDALEAAGWTHADDGAARLYRVLHRWHAAVSRSSGPTWTARHVFDGIAVPFLSALGFTVVPLCADSEQVQSLIHVDGPVASLSVVGWGRDPSSAWREGVRAALAAGVRWAICLNGPAMRVFDASRSHSRRYFELDLARVADDPAASAVVARLLTAPAFASERSALDRALAASELHRAAVRESLQIGVEAALTRLTRAFAAAVPRRRRADDGVLQRCYDESLVVVYRVLFLLFAEARGLVPNWHPIFRDAYTIESLRPVIESSLPPAGVWESLQAIARLAHRGCRAGTLRVPPFNGRLFSPLEAPLADSARLDDRSVQDALRALTLRPDRDATRRITYADLGVEHLGGVYERVLDFQITKSIAGAPMLVRGTQRKTSGSFYTPRALTEYLVRRTLAPLTDNASPEEILALRIVDPAMGSGAFLVAACRYLAQAYESALIREGALSPSDVTEDERAAYRRLVAQRCLHGVDLNPMAVQLARLSLWLASLCRDRPLTFFDHRLRVGNSVAGASLQDMLRAGGDRGRRPTPLPLFDAAGLDEDVSAAVETLTTLREAPEDTLEDVRTKERTFAALASKAGRLARWRRIADLWCAAWFAPADRVRSAAVFRALLNGDALPEHVAEALLATASATAEQERFFHWTFEFADVLGANADGSRGPGFDAVLGNPPWEMLRGDGSRAGGLTRFSRDSGVYRSQGAGHANLFQLFVERALQVVKPGGRVGLVLPAGFATDHGCAELRRRVMDATHVDSVVSVENREALFPIHRGLRFLLLTATSGGRTTEIPLRSGTKSAQDFDALPGAGTDPASVRVSRELISRMSGDQMALPDVRSEADCRIAARLAFAHPAGADREGWGLQFGRELNATDDRGRFTAHGSQATLPVLEGKYIQPFRCDVGAARSFIRSSDAAAALPSRPFRRARLAYRDVASSTNRFTLIAAIVPASAVTIHTLFCLRTPLDLDAQRVLCGLFNSFVANFYVRLRVTTHVTVAIVERLPLPLVARDGAPFARMCEHVRALEADPSNTGAAAAQQALAARLYGLNEEDFAHVLTTFPLVAEAERRRAMEVFRQLERK